MAEQKPTKSDFVDLINSVMGKKIMSEDQLTQFLDNAKRVKDTSGTEGFLEYVQKMTNAPASKEQLKKLADNIHETGNPFSAMDFLKNEKLISEHQLRKLNQAIDDTTKKKRKN